MGGFTHGHAVCCFIADRLSLPGSIVLIRAVRLTNNLDYPWIRTKNGAINKKGDFIHKKLLNRTWYQPFHVDLRQVELLT